MAIVLLLFRLFLTFLDFESFHFVKEVILF
jgi:hypothetical protein